MRPDKEIEKEKKELKRLEKLLSIRGGKEEKEKKFPNSFMHDGPYRLYPICGCG